MDFILLYTMLALRLEMAPRLEQRMELMQKLEHLLPGLGVEGTPANLKKMLRTVPQTTDGEVNYLISGGWACDILSGEQREHKDIDVIILDDGVTYMDTDNMHPSDYFGILSTDEEDMRENHTRMAHWKQEEKYVYVPSPEFLIASKIAPYNGRPSREKDLNDVYNVMRTKKSIDFNKLMSVFSRVSGLEEPGRYALCLTRMHNSVNGNPEQFKQTLATVSEHLADKLR